MASNFTLEYFDYRGVHGQLDARKPYLFRLFWLYKPQCLCVNFHLFDLHTNLVYMH